MRALGRVDAQVARTRLLTGYRPRPPCVGSYQSHRLPRDDAGRHDLLPDAADRFTTVVDATTDWSAPPCEGWTAADVVDHVVDTERDYLSRMDVAMPDRPTGSPEAVWAAHLAAVRPGHRGAAGARVRRFFGRTTIGATLDHFYGFDLVVHGWDLGSAGGRPTTFNDADMD